VRSEIHLVHQQAAIRLPEALDATLDELVDGVARVVARPGWTTTLRTSVKPAPRISSAATRASSSMVRLFCCITAPTRTRGTGGFSSFIDRGL